MTISKMICVELGGDLHNDKSSNPLLSQDRENKRPTQDSWLRTSRI